MVGAGTYYIVGTNSQMGCVSAPMAVTVTVNPTPIVVINNPSAVCSPATVDLTASAVTAGSTPGLTYTYFNDPGATSPVSTPATVGAGTYYIVGTNSQTGCASGPMAVTVTVNPLPSINAVSGTTTICSGNSTILTAGSTDANPTYNWYTSSTGGTSLYTGAAFTTSILSSNTTYYVGVTDGTTGCSSSLTTATVTVNPLPTATLNVNGTPVCLNGTSPSVTFKGSGSTAPYTYNYSINGGALQTISNNGSGSITIQAPTSASGAYTYALISVQDASSTTCTQNITGQSATVTINPLPTATISGATAICQNATSPNVTFAGSGTGPYTFTYSLNNGTTTTSGLTVTGNPATVAAPTGTAGIYTYTLNSVQDANGCPQSVSGQTVQVTVNPLPTASISTASMVTAVSTGNMASVDNAGTGAIYSWTITNGSITAGWVPNSITYTAGTTGTVSLSVSVTSPGGCDRYPAEYCLSPSLACPALTPLSPPPG